MDYYQGVVADYLTADRAFFVKPECLIRLSPAGPLLKSQHWYCDVLAVSFREPCAAYLCEVTFSHTLGALATRLREWNENWPGVRAAVARDNGLSGWPLRPWAFVRRDCREVLSGELDKFLGTTGSPDQMPRPLVTALEDVVPWLYATPHLLPGKCESDA
jgi:hypothetical protein